jgi:hypothetical protein
LGGVRHELLQSLFLAAAGLGLKETRGGDEGEGDEGK